MTQNKKTKETNLTKAGKPKKKPGRKPAKNKRIYFGQPVQDAIIRYNQSENDAERNRIYQEEIHKAFDKLCENIINTFKFTYFDYGFQDVKNEVVAFMVMNMHKYDHTKGSKAFSYFSVVAKNYLILHNNNNYKKLKITDKIDVLDKHRSTYDKEYIADFTEEIVQYFDINIPKMFKKKKDIDIAYSLIELIRRRDEIENFNKKSLYILVREMTNVDTVHITSVVNVYKKHYKNLLTEFYHNGTIDKKTLNKKNSFF